MATLEEARNAISALVRDEKILAPIDYDLALGRALTYYSLFRPLVLSQTISTSANGEVPTSSITSFDQGFLGDLQVEYPISTSGWFNWLDRCDWSLEQTASGQVLRFYAVGAAQSVRIVHRVPHTVPATETSLLTVRGSDVQAVCQWAAAECLQMLADRYSGQTTEGVIMSADMAAFGKGADCEARAQTLRRLFTQHMSNAPGKAYVVRG